MVLEDLTRNLVAPRLGAAAQFFGTYALPVSQLANDMRQRSGVAFFFSSSSYLDQRLLRQVVYLGRPAWPSAGCCIAMEPGPLDAEVMLCLPTPQAFSPFPTGPFWLQGPGPLGAG